MHAGQQIAYNIPDFKIFLEVKVQRAAIVLHLADGGCPDPNGIADDIPRIPWMASVGKAHHNFEFGGP